MRGRLGIVFCAVVLAACGGDEPTGPKATNIVLNLEAVTLQQLDSAQLVASFVDSKGTLIAGVPTTFTSSDPTIVSVSNIGIIRSLGPAGSATVTVRGAGLSKIVAVTVEGVATKLVVTPSPGVLPQKGTLQLTVQLLDRVDAPIRDATFTYQSANSAIATVSATGLVTSVGPAGTVSITVRSGAFAVTSQIAVTQVATRIQVQAPSPLRLGVTRSLKVVVAVLDAVDLPIPGVAFRFTSLNPAVVSVAADGTLTSIGPLGAATVSIEALGTSLTAALQVQVVTATSPLGTDVDSVRVDGGYAVALTPSKAFVVGPFGPPGSSIDLQTNVATPLPGSEPAFGIAVSRDQSRAYLTTETGALRQIDLAVGAFQDLPLTAQGFGLALSRDGRFAYVGTGGGLIFIDLATRAIIERVTLPVVGLHVTVDSISRFAYVSGDGDVAEVDLTTRKLVRTFPIVRGQATALSSDGRTLYVGTENGAVQSVDLVTGTPSLFKATPECGSWGIASTPDDRYLYLACSGQGRIDVMEIQSRQVVRQYSGFEEPRRIAVSDDGATVAVATGLYLVLIR